MYVEIKENKLMSYCENPFMNYEFVDIDYSTFDPNKYEVIDGVLIDISVTQEYIAQEEAKQKEALKADLKSQIEALDIKRIRAIAEPQIKDEITSQTWLEYYTLQIQGIREQIGGL